MGAALSVELGSPASGCNWLQLYTELAESWSCLAGAGAAPPTAMAWLLNWKAWSLRLGRWRLADREGVRCGAAGARGRRTGRLLTCWAGAMWGAAGAFAVSRRLSPVLLSVLWAASPAVGGPALLVALAGRTGR